MGRVGNFLPFHPFLKVMRSAVYLLWLSVLMLGTALLHVFAAEPPRDPWLQPFASDSIWNLPIGTGATYARAHFAPANVNPEPEYLIRIDDSTPMCPLYYPGSPFRANGKQLSWLRQMRVPDDFLVPDITLKPYSTPNDCAAIVHFPSGDIVQLQPTTRLQPGGPIWGFPQTGENLSGQGEKGTHYGSGLSAIGGSIRKGELTQPGPIRHALKLLVQASRYLYRGTPCGPGPRGFGFKWPATQCDHYAHDPPEKNGYGGTDPNLAMGSLVALDRDPATLQLTDPRALKLSQALRDYGAYIVDDTAWRNYAIAANTDAVADLKSIPQADLQKIIEALCVVTNTGPSAKKGPGPPRQPLLPVLAPFSAAASP